MGISTSFSTTFRLPTPSTPGIGGELGVIFLGETRPFTDIPSGTRAAGHTLQGTVELKAPVRRYLPEFRVQSEEASRYVRSGTLVDPEGYSWTIATDKDNLAPDEMQRRQDAFMKNFAPQATHG